MQRHPLQMKLNGFFHQLTRLFKRGSGRKASRKVGDVRSVAVRGACIQNKIFHCFSPACFSIDACVWGPSQWMDTRDRYGSRPDWMMVLPVIAAGTHHLPSVRLDKLDDVRDFHVRYDDYVIPEGGRIADPFGQHWEIGKEVAAGA